MKTYFFTALLLLNFGIYSSENHKTYDFEKECSNDAIIGQVFEYLQDENNSKIVFTKTGVKLVTDCTEDK